MGRTFYTARDIDRFADEGLTELCIDNSIVLTDIARERAHERGLRLVRVPDAGVTPSPERPASADLHERVRAAVIARLGVEPDGLDGIIGSVLRRFQ
jgi:hypothetical protein